LHLTEEPFERLNEALEQGKQDRILDFKGCRITGRLGTGQQGMVLKLTNRIGRSFALKLHRPADVEPSILQNSISRFLGEVNILSTLNHKNIVGMITAGKAEWIEAEERWDIKENLTKDMSPQEFLFYITEFIDGSDLFPFFPEVYTFRWGKKPSVEQDSGKLLAFLEEKLHFRDAQIVERQENQISIEADHQTLRVILKDKNAILEVDGKVKCQFTVKEEDGDIKLTPELEEKRSKETPAEGPTYDKLRMFEALASQVLDAIAYYQSKNYAHMDIKPANIIFRQSDSVFVLVDFGFAHHTQVPRRYHYAVMTRYFDGEAIAKSDYKKSDLGQFARILLEILPSLQANYDRNRYEGISNALEKAIHRNIEERYGNASDFKEALEQYFLTSPKRRFALGLNEYLCSAPFGRFSSKLRLPVSGSVLLTNEVRHLIDTAEFQRLRGMRQLGPTYFVFPGANHTRFEHSLGVYYLTLRYVERLIDLPAFRELCKPIAQTIKLLALASLLHDIGHYPYSHWIEEIESIPGTLRFPAHEDRAREIISQGKIGDLIHREWQIDPDELANVIAQRHIGYGKVLVNSFINSPIDVDKVDYLVRDSVHCGVPYGQGIDIERLLESLTINPSTKTISLTEKGRSCLLSIIACRNIMYQEVYWHKTVRACHAMFKRFFYEYVRANPNTIDELNEYFNYSDDHFVRALSEKSPNKELKELISPFVFEGRTLYKPAYVYYYGSGPTSEEVDTTRFFQAVDRSSYTEMVSLGNMLAEQLKKRIPGLGPYDVIIDKTPVEHGHEKYSLRGFQILNTKKGKFENLPAGLETLNDYLEGNKQAYIFCKPKHYEAFKAIAPKGLSEILGSVT